MPMSIFFLEAIKKFEDNVNQETMKLPDEGEKHYVGPFANGRFDYQTGQDKSPALTPDLSDETTDGKPT